MLLLLLLLFNGLVAIFNSDMFDSSDSWEAAFCHCTSLHIIIIIVQLAPFQCIPLLAANSLQCWKNHDVFKKSKNLIFLVNWA